MDIEALGKRQELSYEEKMEELSKVTIAHIEYEDGRTADGEVICTFDSGDGVYKYFLFRDGTKTQDGLWITYAARYSFLLSDYCELTDEFEDYEIGMVEEVINTDLAKGFFKKTPLLKLQLHGVKSVTFS